MTGAQELDPFVEGCQGVPSRARPAKQKQINAYPIAMCKKHFRQVWPAHQIVWIF